MATDVICQAVADAWLAMLPDDFDDWLAHKAAKNPGSAYEWVLSAHLAGYLTEEWARDHASSGALCY